ncbi:T9SS type A sorting domain-containing protein [Owenweeksia hongkongensis]|uniref:T9SS type A sorting domain-containing protein n=1 Tax=Owenweeksia hongkongensis TaxID=253245 RepID=UPI003A9590CB
MRSSILSLWACILLSTALSSQGKIVLTPDMLINVTTIGDASLLIDEQQLAGDPRSGAKSTPSTHFYGGYNSMYFPLRIVIDLKAVHQLSELYVFDSFNVDSLKIYTGKPSSWQLDSVLWLNEWNRWKSVSLNINTRYLMLEFPSTKAVVSEIVLYGYSTSSKTPIPARTFHSPPLMEDFLGTNALHNEPIDKLRCVGSIREYHPWQWDEGNGSSSYPGYPNNQYAWSPSWVSGPGWGWDFDQTYTSFLNAGLDLSPCLQQTAPYMLDKSTNVDQKPISLNDDPENPNSYEEHARYLYQFTARYGSTTVPPSKLMLRPGQPVHSGLNLIKYIENNNEPDKWWRGREGYFSPFEMAAMCSADYDGHEGRMGDGYGAKNADPNIQFVMGGLTILGLEYIKSMKLWSDIHRTSGFPADVLNFHHYSNSSGGQDQAMKDGISPEDDSLKYKLKEIVEYRDRYLPGKEIWLSEFGYDTNPNSPQGARAIGQNDVYEVQAQWLLRSYLEMAAAGIDRAHVYFFADLNALNPNKFNSSGLVNEKWYGYQPKTSWYYIYAMKKALRGYRFGQEIASQNSSVNVYRFDNDSTATSIYVAWCNTSTDKTINNFKINLGDALGATLLELNKTDTVCTESALQLKNKGDVKVCLSERPIFIRAVHSNSTDCIEVEAKNTIHLQLDQQGQASITPADVDNGSKSNCGPLSFAISKSLFDCSDVSGGYYVEIQSDSTWKLSTVFDASTNMTFPWTGVSGNLPAASTFTSPVVLGQPKNYKSIDNVPGSDVIQCDKHVTFYRKTFYLLDNNQADFFAEMTVDDDMEIYLNGHLIAREESHVSTNSSFPSHRFQTPGYPTVNNSVHESFDIIASNASSYLIQGTNEVILAVRNKGGKDNGGFSFRMGIGNPSAGGHHVTLTATDNVTLESATVATTVLVVDNLSPAFDLVQNPAVHLDNTGIAAVNLSDVRNSITDNCLLHSVEFKPSTVSFAQLKDSAIIEIVSNKTWAKSSYTDSRNAFTFPWPGVIELPDSTTYTIKASVGQPFSFQGIYPIPRTEVISTDAHVTFFRKKFVLNIDSISECWIDLTVDDDAEIYINGHLLAREGSFYIKNSQVPAHRIHYNSTSVTNGFSGGDAFDYVSTSNLASILNPKGSNEIILAVRNGSNSNVGGFSFKLSIPLTEKNHVPVTITASDKYGNTNTAYTSVELKDTIPPTIVTTNPVLTPNASGIINLDISQFNNGSFDNTAIESFSIFPSTITCGSLRNTSLYATDYFGNTSSTTLNLLVDTVLCPNLIVGGKKSGSSRTNSSDEGTDDPLASPWSFRAYPLPAKDNVTVDVNKTIPGETVTFEVWDLSGRLLLSINNTAPAYKYSTQLDLTELAAGEYLLTVKHQNQSKTTKLLIN